MYNDNLEQEAAECDLPYQLGNLNRNFGFSSPSKLKHQPNDDILD